MKQKNPLNKEEDQINPKNIKKSNMMNFYKSNMTNFYNIKITHIIAFEAVLKKFNKTWLKGQLTKTNIFDKSETDFLTLSDEIYDLDYINYNDKSILCINPKLSLITSRFTDEENILFNCHTLQIHLNFDKCGIANLKLDFVIRNPLKAESLIELADETCRLADEYIFDIIKSDLKEIFIKKPTLNVHKTYSVISSFNNKPVIYNEKELFGISWIYNDYTHVSDNIFKEIMENNKPIRKNDTILVTTQSTLLIFLTNDNDYNSESIEDRITAIEMFWRQKHLLQKLDYEIRDLFDKVEEEIDSDDLNSAIKRLAKSRVSLYSELDIYKNTNLSVMQSFSILLNKFNAVFRLKEYYEFVESKINACNDLYKGLLDEKRNNADEKRNELMKNIQIIVFILGGVSLILLLFSDIAYNISIPKEIKELSYTICILGIISAFLYIVINTFYNNK